MKRDLQDNLSYVIRINGEWVPAMPEDGEFSLQEIRDFVAGSPRVICLTPDGYKLFQNTDAALKALPINEAATAIVEASGGSDSVRGRVFLAHPAHVAAFWTTSRDEDFSESHS